MRVVLLFKLLSIFLLKGPSNSYESNQQRNRGRRTRPPPSDRDLNSCRLQTKQSNKIFFF